MDKPIKITKKIKFGFSDLMRNIDPNYKFTLKDVLRACVNSEISLTVLQEIIHCPYLEEYWKEMNSKKFKNDGDIEYLELSWASEINEYDGKIDSGHMWNFNGMGKEGVISEDIIKFSSKAEINKLKKENYRQSYAIEFTPMYELSNYDIRIEKYLSVSDWRKYEKLKTKKDFEDIYTKLDVQPSITLVELLYWIFWELSFCGSPKQRDDKGDEIGEIVKEFEKAKAEGTLNDITIPWEEAKKKLIDKFK